MNTPQWVLSALASAIIGVVAVLFSIMINAIIENSREIADIYKARATYEERLDGLNARIDRDNERLQRSIDGIQRSIDDLRKFKTAEDGP